MKTNHTLISFALLAGLTATPLAAAGSTLTVGSYTYDPSGNIHKIVGSVGTETFVYDHYGRVLSGTHAMPFPETPVSQQYTYDRYGNIKTISTTGAPDRTFAVDAATNQLDAAVGLIKGTYDAAGNQTTLVRGDAGVSASFVYDGLNVTNESTVAGVRRQYLYNASDERLALIEGTVSGGTTGKQQWTVRNAMGQVLRRFTRSTSSASLQWDEDYLYREDKMLAAFVTDPERVLHFHTDHLGSPRLITGNGGARVSEHRYYAFGEEFTPRVNGAEQKKFTGHERDSIDNAPAADVDYMHARVYGTRDGRFLSMDPASESSVPENPQSWNRYAYALNNPVRFTDPDGRAIEQQPRNEYPKVYAAQAKRLAQTPVAVEHNKRFLGALAKGIVVGLSAATLPARVALGAAGIGFGFGAANSKSTDPAKVLAAGADGAGNAVVIRSAKNGLDKAGAFSKDRNTRDDGVSALGGSIRSVFGVGDEFSDLVNFDPSKYAGGPAPGPDEKIDLPPTAPPRKPQPPKPPPPPQKKKVYSECTSHTIC